MEKFQLVDLAKIGPDPNQPRKYFDESAQKDLTDSIREKGIIQPIVIRKDPADDSRFILVTGERRYRSALAIQEEDKKRNKVPAIVRDLSDQEALEFQIIENLQRQEVHPMEEAQAFAKLHQIMSVSELAPKVGKSESYVLKRLKLNELIPEAQELFLADKVEYSDVLRFARIDKDQQKEILNANTREIDRGNFYFIKTAVSRETKQLSEAKFPISNPSLYPLMGSCTTCQFNTENMGIQFDGEKEHRCTRVSCFQIKSDTYDQLLFESAKDKFEYFFINSSWLNDAEKRDIELAEKSGLQVLDYKYVSRHKSEENLQTFEEWKEEEYPDYEEEEELEDGEEQEPKPSLEELRSEYEHYKNCFEAEQKVFFETMESEGWKKAYCIGGYSKHKTYFIKLTGSAPAPSSSSSDPAEAEIRRQIEDLQQKEKRNEELDDNKIFEAVVEFAWAEYTPKDDTICKPYELEALAETLYRTMEPRGKKLVDQMFPDPIKSNSWPRKRGQFKNVTGADLYKMLRIFIVDKLPTKPSYQANHKTDEGNGLFYMVIKNDRPFMVEEIESDQSKTAAIRKEKLKAKIEALQKPKKKPGKQLEISPELETVEENG